MLYISVNRCELLTERALYECMLLSLLLLLLLNHNSVIAPWQLHGGRLQSFDRGVNDVGYEILYKEWRKILVRIRSFMLKPSLTRAQVLETFGRLFVFMNAWIALWSDFSRDSAFTDGMGWGVGVGDCKAVIQLLKGLFALSPDHVLVLSPR